MNDNIYNTLPSNIKQKFQIVYSKLLYDNITLFKNSSNKWGILTTIKTIWQSAKYAYLLDPIFNSLEYNQDLGLIQGIKYEKDISDNNKKIFFYFDIKGNEIWQSNEGESVNTDKFKNIFLRRNNKIGLLDQLFNLLIEPKYDSLIAITENILKARQDDKYGIVNRNDIIILGFEFDYIFETSTNNKIIVEKDSKYFCFNIDNYSLSELPFKKILKASSNSYKAPSQGSLNLYKSIINLEENKYYKEHNWEMLQYYGKWGIVNSAGEIVIPNSYCFIDFLRNPNYFKVGLGNIEIKEYTDANQTNRISIKNVKWGIVDNHNNVIVPIEYDWIDEVESTIWVVHKGGRVFYNDDYQEDYWTIEKSKLGVYNLEKLITPVQYDTISKNWSRIKDYIFVQNGKPFFDINLSTYDVYTLDGIKIEDNKPYPKNHLYYD